MGPNKANTKLARLAGNLTYSYNKLQDAAERKVLTKQEKNEAELSVFNQIISSLQSADAKIQELENDRGELYNLLVQACGKDGPEATLYRAGYMEPTVSSTKHRHQRAQLLTLKEKLTKLGHDKYVLARNLAATRARLYHMDKEKLEADEQFASLDNQIKKLYKALDRVGDELDVWQQTSVKLAKRKQELEGENTVLAKQLLEREELLEDLRAGVADIRLQAKQRAQEAADMIDTVAAEVAASPGKSRDLGRGSPLSGFIPARTTPRAPTTHNYSYGRPSTAPATGRAWSLESQSTETMPDLGMEEEEDDDDDDERLYNRAMRSIEAVRSAKKEREEARRRRERAASASRMSALMRAATAPGVQRSSAGGTSPLVLAGSHNLNTCSVAELMAVPHIGPIRANRIVAERRAQGPFQDFYDFASRMKPLGVEAGSCLRLIRHGYYILN